jgi:hypothetical protein
VPADNPAATPAVPDQPHDGKRMAAHRPVSTTMTHNRP